MISCVVVCCTANLTRSPSWASAHWARSTLPYNAYSLPNERHAGFHVH